MPARSISQQQLFGIALAVRRKELKRSEVNKEVLDIVDSDMTDEKIREFAKTKHKGLKKYVKENMKDLNELLNESLLTESNAFDKMSNFLKNKSKVKSYLKKNHIDIPNIEDYLDEINRDIYSNMDYSYLSDMDIEDIDFDQAGADFYHFHEELDEQIDEIIGIYKDLFQEVTGL